jgi:hypothetical protein
LIALVGPALGALLRKEKDEASPPKLFFWRIRRISSIPRLRSLEVFLFSGFALVSQLKPFRGFFICGTKN